MDIHYIETRFIITELKNFDKLLEILPEEIGIVSILQFIDIARKIKEELTKRGFKVYSKRSFGLYEMQILGCNLEAANVEPNTILFIGDSMFHALEISRKLKKKVIIYNPANGMVKEIKGASDYKRKIDILLAKLKISQKIGIIMSIKPGQFYIKEALKIRDFLNREGKETYLFLADNIDFSEFLNFPDIEFWIIVACPRLLDDIIERGINALTFDLVMEKLWK